MSEKYLNWYELDEKRWRNDPRPGHFSFRDSQRQRLYDAEKPAHYLMEEQNLNPSFSSIEEIQQFVDKLISSAWLKKRFKYTDGWKINIVKGRCNSNSAYVQYMTNSITLPMWAWNKMIILHELSHFIARKYEGAHGRFFARAYLELIGHVLGPDARKILKEQYRKHGVKYTPKKQLTEKDRQARRERFIQNVLKQEIMI